MPTAQTDSDRAVDDVNRRTWLAAERTWLAWWRSGLAVGAVALAVGRFLPELTHHARWPFRVLGVGYGVLSVAVLVIGGIRQRRTADALRREAFAELSSPLVAWLTAGAIGLSVLSIVLVVAAI
jgi:putative membrane protein